MSHAVDGHVLRRGLRLFRIPPFATVGVLTLALIVGLGSPPSARAQDAQTLSEDPLTALAGALLRLEYAMVERPVLDEDRARVNLAFDAATLAFFAGRTDEVLSRLDALTAEVEPDPDVRARQAAAAVEVLLRLPTAGQTLAAPRPPVPFRIAGPGEPGSSPLPVVVALHGAGGNEHMFVEAYGAGKLTQLADSLGFVVISPQTNIFAAGGAAGMLSALDGMLEAAEAQYVLDRSRIGVVGHSMGAGVAWQLAMALQPDGDARIRAVACLAGPCGQGGGGVSDGETQPYPPLLLIAGELDPLAPPARMAPAAESASARGIQVTYKELPGQGHTLVVGAILDEVIEWLLEWMETPLASESVLSAESIGTGR